MIRIAVGAIVTCGDQFLLVHKSKINTKNGKQDMESEWDFVKGGVKLRDADLESALIRELEEETGTKSYKILNQFDEKLCFHFPEKIRGEIGYDRQETTMFHVKYIGDKDKLIPHDDEIKDVQFVDRETAFCYLTHKDTKKYFKKQVELGRIV
ncbi:NUDIX domain-containing protein [Ornithinibacillus sp. L9]|uniref:NUDIX domain-containing protein n=1 Tax=Ornithinibacillus caprae TaxID=2678566 RepID=A0A6N8FJG4_9BACI|nr:NUDIX hydrolase [Ornithinibacillus caprae]MUK88826.1 NUDIX domain-containing protein [Ornithinibacillus caprae]